MEYKPIKPRFNREGITVLPLAKEPLPRPIPRIAGAYCNARGAHALPQIPDPTNPTVYLQPKIPPAD